MATLHDKNALIIGGSRGIGAATVRRLRREGARVTFTYFGSEAAATALANETGATALHSNAADKDAVVAAVRSVDDLDILVVNAGAFVAAPIDDLDLAAVDHMLAINIHGPFHAAIEGGRTMREGGRIVLIGSVNADRVPFVGGGAYGMTKSALQGLARGLSRDLGPKSITINVVQPGPVDTDMNPEDGPMRDLMHSFLAIKRHGRPEEIAGMVAYLTGPDGAYVTGAMHTIDGGFGA